MQPANPRGNKEAPGGQSRSMTSATEAFDLVTRARRAAGGRDERRAMVGVKDGSIAAVAPIGQAATGAEEIELGADEVLLPGLVDTHVHVCEPGHADWEGFAAAT